MSLRRTRPSSSFFSQAKPVGVHLKPSIQNTATYACTSAWTNVVQSHPGQGDDLRVPCGEDDSIYSSRCDTTSTPPRSYSSARVVLSGWLALRNRVLLLRPRDLASRKCWKAFLATPLGLMLVSLKLPLADLESPGLLGGGPFQSPTHPRVYTPWVHWKSHAFGIASIAEELRLCGLHQ